MRVTIEDVIKHVRTIDDIEGLELLSGYGSVRSVKVKGGWVFARDDSSQQYFIPDAINQLKNANDIYMRQLLEYIESHGLWPSYPEDM